MSDNLLKPGEFYYHPLTRVAPPSRVFSIDPDGNEVISVPPVESKVTFRSHLDTRDIVSYFYKLCGISPVHHNYARDEGGLRFLIKKLGLDITLFCIDSLVSDYMENEDRNGHAPELISASNYTDYAMDRIGQVKAVAQQYNLLEPKPITVFSF